MPSSPNVLRVAAWLFYWGWNLWFVLWMWLGLGPLVVWDLLVAVGVGLIPVPFGLCALALLTLPLLGLGIGLHPHVRTDPRRLLALLYGVQVPLMVLCATRLFGVQVLTWPTGLALAVITLGTVSLARVVWRGPRASHPALLLMGASTDLLAGWWLAAVLALYAVPVPFLVVRILSVGESLPLVVLLTLTCGVLVSFPIARVGLTTRAFELVWRASVERLGIPRAAALTTATIGGLILVIALAGRQPHQPVFEQLESADTDAERAVLLERGSAIRRGLLFARLSPALTFPFHDPLLDNLYEAGPGINTNVPAQIRHFLLTPFVYHPVHPTPEARWAEPRDVSEATASYGAFFDEPIEVAERDVLLAAARATWDWQTAHAGLLDVGQRQVHLAVQQITVEAHDDFARIEVHEVYNNQTWDRKEVLISFSLPESAAIDGLWLGTTPNRDEAFPFVVAPRGAAQAVYEAEVRVRRDPALLEQVGPRQYRLRAFPVEPRTGDPGKLSSIQDHGPDLHLWMSILTPMEDRPDGPVYPLPRPAEVRNLFWDEQSVRTLNGEPFETEDWMPTSPETVSARRPHAWTVGAWTVHAEPIGSVTPQPLGEVAVVVDGTRSMERHRAAIGEALTQLGAVSRSMEVWCTREQQMVRCPDFDPERALYWGAVPVERHLSEVAPHLTADLVLVLTDEGSVSLSAAADELAPVSLPPVWLVHFGAFPAAYTDWTLDAVTASGGGVVANVDELLVRWSDPDLLDGYRWSVRAAEADAADTAAPVAARAVVRTLARTIDRSDRAQLDRLHAVATRGSVVTPWSSMLVLVDHNQRQALAEAASASDRFDREVLDSPSGPPELVAVPEPGTAVLLVVGAAAWWTAGALRRRVFTERTYAPPNAEA